MQLQAAVECIVLHLSGPPFRFGGICGGEFPVDVGQHALIDVGLRNVDAGIDFAQEKLVGLEAADRLVEGDAVLGVLDGLLDELSHMSKIRHRSGEALPGSQAIICRNPPAKLADEVRAGHPDIVKEQLGGIRFWLSELLQLVTPADDGGHRRNGEQGKPPGAGARRDPRRDDDEVGAVAVGFAGMRAELIRSAAWLDAAQVRALYATLAIVLRRPAAEQAAVPDRLEHLVADRFAATLSGAS